LELFKRSRKPDWGDLMIPAEFEGDVFPIFPREYDPLHWTWAQERPPTHVKFTKWPDDPEKTPFKKNFFCTIINPEAVPQLKRGTHYTHEYLLPHGVPLWLTKPDFPKRLVIDMARAVKGSLYMEHMDLPEGSRLRYTRWTATNDFNCLVARVTRIKPVRGVGG